jgi:uncharacterized protein (TIGR02246 family)
MDKSILSQLAAPAAAFMATVFAMACTPPAEEPAPAEPVVDIAAEEAAIMELEREWSAMFGARDVDAILNLHAADAVQLPPGMEPVIGQEALRAAWEGFATLEGFDVSWEPTAAHVSPDGNMAYDYGTSSMTLPDGTVQNGKYLVVWVKVDGEWKVAADMFNSNVAP